MSVATPPSKTIKVKRVSAATQYAQDVVHGRIVAGELVIMACQRHLDDLRAVQRGDRPDLKWDWDEGERALKLFGYLKQWKGRWAGETFQLVDWQKFVVACAFGWKIWDEHLGRWVRRFREVYVSVARKNGKTTMAAGVGIFLLDFDDEPGAEVYFVASKRDQAKQGWDTMVHIIGQDRDLSARIKHIASTNKLICYETGSTCMPLGRDSDTEHGLNPSGAIIDELHVHKNRDMVDAIETAIGTRTEPLIWYITTAGVEGASIYVETDDRARRVVKGISPDDRMLVYIASLDEDDDWADERNYIKGNPSLGVTIQLDELMTERDKAVSTPGRQNSFKRLRLNMRTNSETAWLDLRKWDACQVQRLTLKGRTHVGVDLGGRQDLSAAARVTADPDGKMDIEWRFWMPKELVQEAEERDGVHYGTWAEHGWLTLTDGDYRDDDRIAEDLTRWAGQVGGVLEFDLDAWNSTTLVSKLQSRGYTIVEVAQTFNSLSPAVEIFEDGVNDGLLHHVDNPIVRWMLSNCALDERPDGGRKPAKMDTKKHRRRIDGISAALDALARLPATATQVSDVWDWGAV
jgi:phage terminase large subunit-like protein